MAFYLGKRREVFQTYHKNNMDDNALQYAINFFEASNFSSPQKYGLKTELYFYHRYRKRLSLVVASDSKDLTDFSGKINELDFRIDLTSNNHPRYKTKMNSAYHRFKDTHHYTIIEYDFRSDTYYLDNKTKTCGICGTPLYHGLIVDDKLQAIAVDFIDICPNTNISHPAEQVSEFLFSTSIKGELHDEELDYLRSEIKANEKLISKVTSKEEFEEARFIDQYIDSLYNRLESIEMLDPKSDYVNEKCLELINDAQLKGNHIDFITTPKSIDQIYGDHREKVIFVHDRFDEYMIWFKNMQTMNNLKSSSYYISNYDAIRLEEPIILVQSACV